MRRFVLFLLAAVGLVALCHGRASATACSIPNTFTNGTVADATQVNANFSNLQSCANNIDFTNIGSNGIYASQIIADTTGHATFGGSQIYTFPAGLTINGTLLLNQTVANTINSNSTGSVDAFILNATNAAQPSGNLLNLKANGTSEFALSMAGVPTFTGLTTGTLCVHSVTKALASMGGDCLVNGTTVTVAQGGTNLTSLAGSKCIRSASTTAYAEAAADCLSANVAATSPITVSGGTAPNIACATCAVTNANNNFSASQTVAGNITGSLSTSAVNLGVSGTDSGTSGGFAVGSAGQGNFTRISANAGSSVNGVAGDALVIGNNSLGVADVTISSGGNMGVAGFVKSVGLNATTGTIQGSSNGSTVSYLPPVYTAAGAAVASTAHTVFTTNSCAVAASGSGIQCTSTITLTGAAVFTSAATYSCSVVENTSSASNLTPRATAVSGTSVQIDYTFLIAVSSIKTYNTNVVCTGT